MILPIYDLLRYYHRFTVRLHTALLLHCSHYVVVDLLILSPRFRFTLIRSRLRSGAWFVYVDDLYVRCYVDRATLHHVRLFVLLPVA